SEGSAALHLPTRKVLFVGDALATLNVLSGKTGPQLAPFGSDFARARESLRKIKDLDADVVLPGHGQPWTGGVGEAVRIIQEGAPHSQCPTASKRSSSPSGYIRSSRCASRPRTSAARRSRRPATTS